MMIAIKPGFEGDSQQTSVFLKRVSVDILEDFRQVIMETKIGIKKLQYLLYRVKVYELS